MSMRHFVPLFIYVMIFKAVIGTKVDNFYLGINCGCLTAHLHGMAMRQTNKNNVTLCCDFI